MVQSINEAYHTLAKISPNSVTHSFARSNLAASHPESSRRLDQTVFTLRPSRERRNLPRHPKTNPSFRRFPTPVDLGSSASAVRAPSRRHLDCRGRRLRFRPPSPPLPPVPSANPRRPNPFHLRPRGPSSPPPGEIHSAFCAPVPPSGARPNLRPQFRPPYPPNSRKLPGLYDSLFPTDLRCVVSVR